MLPKPVPFNVKDPLSTGEASTGDMCVIEGTPVPIQVKSEDAVFDWTELYETYILTVLDTVSGVIISGRVKTI